MFRVVLAELPQLSARLLGTLAARVRDADPELDKPAEVVEATRD
jgi:hypothetical protein